MSNGPVEPTADMRAFAGICWQMFNALRLEGFSETQALVVIGQVIQAQLGGGSK
jgi:hypothetical protein